MVGVVEMRCVGDRLRQAGLLFAGWALPTYLIGESEDRWAVPTLRRADHFRIDGLLWNLALAAVALPCLPRGPAGAGVGDEAAEGAVVGAAGGAVGLVEKGVGPRGLVGAAVELG